MDQKLKKLFGTLAAIVLVLAMGFLGGSEGQTPHSSPDSSPAYTQSAGQSQQAQSRPESSTASTGGQQTHSTPVSSSPAQSTPVLHPGNSPPALDEHGSYDSKEEVALYLQLYGRLPDNYITKKEAEALGWQGGSVEVYAPGKCIGGSRFGNYEGLLPDAPGRSWTECDIDTLGQSSRGAKRIVFSNDGLIYYTPDHYASFELLYGGDTP